MVKSPRDYTPEEKANYPFPLKDQPAQPQPKQPAQG
jgi:hypothetical protein